MEDDLVGHLMARACAGDDAAQGVLLERYRNYLLLIARSLLGRSLRSQVDASDLVQETLFRAHRHFHQFRGTDEPELIGWLRQILVHHLSNQVKFHHRRVRDLGRQVSLGSLLDLSGQSVARARVLATSSPSSHASHRERAVLLADALAQLEPDEREVVLLRAFEQHSFRDIAEAMGSSADAARRLWARALAALHRILETEP